MVKQQMMEKKKNFNSLDDQVLLLSAEKPLGGPNCIWYNFGQTVRSGREKPMRPKNPKKSWLSVDSEKNQVSRVPS
ncbi:hypothetical protein KI387_019939, partial [Taxus chinensis]